MTNKPDPITLEGVVYHANEVLLDCLGPKVKGIPKELFGTCKGVAILDISQIGVVFAGSVGSGILLKKTNDEGGWSAPIAVDVSGSGFGALLGGNNEHVICFMMDDDAMAKVLEKKGLSITHGSLELAVGFGRAKPFGIGLKKKVIPLVYSQGTYIGLGIQGNVLIEQPRSNKAFYGDDVSMADVLDGKVGIPEGKVTMIENIYEKLNGPLAQGEAMEGPTPEEEAKKSEAKAAADAASVEIAKGDDVITVDASKEVSTKDAPAAEPEPVEAA